MSEDIVPKKVTKAEQDLYTRLVTRIAEANKMLTVNKARVSSMLQTMHETYGKIIEINNTAYHICKRGDVFFLRKK